MINIALPKGRLSKDVFELMKKADYLIQESENSRALVVVDSINRFTYFFVKPSDVITYVKEGVCDIGVVGKDNIEEEQEDIYELLDLNIGKCKMVIAGTKDLDLTQKNALVVATKYKSIAKDYLKSRFNPLKIVYLNGSVELGPIVGLSDCIVDIYETGSTLKANNLEVKESLFEISARLVANKASYRMKFEDINNLVKNLEKVVI